MSSSRRRVLQPATIALSAAAFVALVAASISPFVPAAAALDPTSDPSASAPATPAPTPDPATPAPTVAPLEPTPDPALSPAPEAPTPAPADPTPSAPTDPVEDFPLYPLVDPEPPIIVPMSLITPGQPSPHIMDSLVTDGCGACHRSHVASDEKLLIAAYRTDLKPVNEAYAAAEFALCYTCHEAAPFEAEDTGGTNFEVNGHDRHLSALGGAGNAVCAECHYRLHATAGEAGTKLVNFAPNVTANGGTLEWTGTVTRSCTLTCHGYAHAAEGY